MFKHSNPEMIPEEVNECILVSRQIYYILVCKACESENMGGRTRVHEVYTWAKVLRVQPSLERGRATFEIMQSEFSRLSSFSVVPQLLS